MTLHIQTWWGLLLILGNTKISDSGPRCAGAKRYDRKRPMVEVDVASDFSEFLFLELPYVALSDITVVSSI